MRFFEAWIRNGGVSLLASLALSYLNVCVFKDVTVLSPNNYFNFTPLLAGCAVGTLELRCAVEPVSAVYVRSEILEIMIMQVRRYAPKVVSQSLFRYIYLNSDTRHNCSPSTDCLSSVV